MKHALLTLTSVFALASVMSAADIEGKIARWPGSPPSADQPAVVWLDGLQREAPGKNEPVMAQRAGKFAPSFLVVVAGQTVSMPNDDNVAHNVYSVSAAKPFNLGFYAKGDIRTVTFDRPGLVDVLCLIHNFMRARILVVPNPYYAIVAPDGTFRIRNVPPGTFSLNFWGPGMATFSQEVTVPAEGRPVTVEVSWPAAPTEKK